METKINENPIYPEIESNEMTAEKAKRFILRYVS